MNDLMTIYLRPAAPESGSLHDNFGSLLAESCLFMGYS